MWLYSLKLLILMLHNDPLCVVEHLLIALAETDTRFLLPYLRKIGKSASDIVAAVKAVRGPHRVDSRNFEETHQALEKYGTNLTAKAARGELDPVIGRDEAIRRVTQILSRRTSVRLDLTMNTVCCCCLCKTRLGALVSFLCLSLQEEQSSYFGRSRCWQDCNS